MAIWAFNSNPRSSHRSIVAPCCNSHWLMSYFKVKSAFKTDTGGYGAAGAGTKNTV